MKARYETLENIAANLQNAGFSLGWVSALDVDRRPIFVVEAHGYGKRFIVRGDEILIAFVELQRAIHEFAVGLIVQWPRKRCADEKLTAFLEMEKSGLYPPVD